MQAERQEFFVVPTTVHRKNLKKQQLLSPFLFCLGAVCERGRGGAGRRREVGGVESHIRGTTGKRTFHTVLL